MTPRRLVQCVTCGQVVDIDWNAHEFLRRWYCETHCPSCNPPPP